MPKVCNAQISLILLLMIGGCATPMTGINTGPNGYVTIATSDSSGDSDMVRLLRANHVRIEKNPDGDEQIFDSLACRSILVKFRRAMQDRLNLIAQNIANEKTTHDENGKLNPYRRKFIVLGNDASVQIKTDPSPFIMHYDPSSGDADAKGYVRYPNVDSSVENVDSIIASRSYELATRILRRFDPSYVQADAQ